MEPKLWKCILALAPFFEARGIILDAGANNGASSVMLAGSFPNHTIWAIEPVRANIVEITRRTRSYRNVRILRGGLGAKESNGSYGASLDGVTNLAHKTGGPQFGAVLKYNLQQRLERAQTQFPIFTLDKVVGRDTLAFGHFDVEGMEEDVVRGGRRTLMRDRPLFSFERFPLSRRTAYNAMMEIMKTYDYETYQISESCGAGDCSNYIALPSEKQIEFPKQCSCINCE